MKPKSFVMPKRIRIEEETRTPQYTKFIIEPLERGFGTTLGNSLRRVLLSFVQGAAPRWVRIEGVLQEVSYIPGVVEDVTDIILNLKQLVIRMHKTRSTKLEIDATGPGEVTGASFVPNPDVEILNPDIHIATLEEGGVLKLEMEIAQGRGFVAAEMNKDDSLPINTIPMDSVFTPVRRVKYNVEATRVAEITDYDRLILEIWTDGTISPEDSLGFASKIVKDHLALFINFLDHEFFLEEEGKEEDIYINPNLYKSVDELELSVRSYNCLKAANIRTIAQLVQKSEAEMLKYRNFGKKSLNEIKELLSKMGLSLGMALDDERVRASIEEHAADIESEEDEEKEEMEDNEA